jgi:hypothetical protein
MGLFWTSTSKCEDEENPSKLSNEGDESGDHHSKPVLPHLSTKFSATGDDHDRSMTDVELGEMRSFPPNETSLPPNQAHLSTHSAKATSSGSSSPKLPSFLTMRENADLKKYQTKNFER